jgi:hypothetical protein
VSCISLRCNHTVRNTKSNQTSLSDYVRIKIPSNVHQGFSKTYPNSQEIIRREKPTKPHARVQLFTTSKDVPPPIDWHEVGLFILPSLADKDYRDIKEECPVKYYLLASQWIFM